MEKNIKIFIAGHNGMVGRACIKALEKKGYDNLIVISSKELDLRNQNDVFNFIKIKKPSIIINAAARVGGIHANNTFPYEFLIDNLSIQNNLIQAAHANEVKRFVFLGSSCIYPKLAPQPIKEKDLLSSELEPTNQWYAIAKIAGVKLIEALNLQYNEEYVCLMPTNLYGPNDNFDLQTSHVLPALIRKIHLAKINNESIVELWGDGTPLREFLHVDDLAQAILFVLEKKTSETIYNVGSGQEVSIKDLAHIIQSMINFKGQIKWNVNMPNGTPRKLLDSSKLLDLGWKPKIKLETGLLHTYEWYKQNF